MSEPSLPITHQTDHNHSIDPANLSRAAVLITRDLREAGYEALLVGGCVRDLLLGYSPKDYDIATNATPEQVRQVFRRARIIGRRFKIVHVRVGREVIEVTTYRRAPEDEDGIALAKSGRILEDNVYGDLDSDAQRRDFTVNALYYDPVSNEGIDHVDGLDDLEQRLLRMIGDPGKRFSEDPVRILRAIRFMAKLGFEIESETESALRKSVTLLRGVPAARLFDEVLKLFHHGHGELTARLLNRYGVFKILFPVLKTELPDRSEEIPQIITHALRNTDKRVKQDKPVIAAFLFAAFLWPAAQKRCSVLIESGTPPIEALQRACDDVVADECKVVAIPRRVSAVVREIWELEYRLRERRPRSIQGILENRRFRAAYDFLLLRCEIDDGDAELADWWRRIQVVDDATRHEMIGKLRGSLDGKRRRRSRRPRTRKPA